MRHTGRYDADERMEADHWRNAWVRVRGTAYLWGSAGISKDVEFHTPLVLHVRNDDAGEAVTIGTETANGAKATLGTLQPGERFSIPIQKVRGVFATCSKETSVHCDLRR